jgi:hypothetical protein
LHRITLSFILQESPNGFVFVEEQKNNLNKGGRPSWVEGMRLFGDITTWIAVPIVLALILGKFLDRRYGTEPIIFLSLAGLGFFVTCSGIVKIAKEYLRKQNTKK